VEHVVVGKNSKFWNFSATQQDVTGEVPISPVQKNFLLCTREFGVLDSGDPDEIINSKTFIFVFDSKRNLDPKKFQNSVQKISEFHDMLRARFSLPGGRKERETEEDREGERREGPKWEQHLDPCKADDEQLSEEDEGEEREGAERSPVGYFYETTNEPSIENCILRATKQIEISEGRLFSLGLVEFCSEGKNPTQKIILAIHKLVADVDSVKFLISDFTNAYFGIPFPPKPTSFLNWITRVTNSDSDSDTKHTTPEESPSKNGSTCYALDTVITFTCTGELSRKILKKATHNQQPQHLLLAAFVGSHNKIPDPGMRREKEGEEGREGSGGRRRRQKRREEKEFRKKERRRQRRGEGKEGVGGKRGRRRDESHFKLELSKLPSHVDVIKLRNNFSDLGESDVHGTVGCFQETMTFKMADCKFLTMPNTLLKVNSPPSSLLSPPPPFAPLPPLSPPLPSLSPCPSSSPVSPLPPSRLSNLLTLLQTKQLYDGYIKPEDPRLPPSSPVSFTYLGDTSLLSSSLLHLSSVGEEGLPEYTKKMGSQNSDEPAQNSENPDQDAETPTYEITESLATLSEYPWGNFENSASLKNHVMPFLAPTKFSEHPLEVVSYIHQNKLVTHFFYCSRMWNEKSRKDGEGKEGGEGREDQRGEVGSEREGREGEESERRGEKGARGRTPSSYVHLLCSHWRQTLLGIADHCSSQELLVFKFPPKNISGPVLHENLPVIFIHGAGGSIVPFLHLLKFTPRPALGFR
jgi:hypothetical protein